MSDQIKESVRKHYASAISGTGGCCSAPGGLEIQMKGKFAQLSGYSAQELSKAPEEAVNNSFACGNPIAHAELKEGETVLDIGSGAGLDAILSAKEVGPLGKVYGLDMTPEMIAKAKENVKKADLTNVEFIFGEAENIPLQDNLIDVTISNCVINLSPDKAKVFSEIYRALKPGGRMVISDIVSSNLPAHAKEDMKLWAGCLGGALDEEEYLTLIRKAGFHEPVIVERMDFNPDSFNEYFSQDGCCGVIPGWATELLRESGWKVSSIKVRAYK